MAGTRGYRGRFSAKTELSVVISREIPSPLERRRGEVARGERGRRGIGGDVGELKRREASSRGWSVWGVSNVPRFGSYVALTRRVLVRPRRRRHHDRHCGYATYEGPCVLRRYNEIPLHKAMDRLHDQVSLSTHPTTLRKPPVLTRIQVTRAQSITPPTLVTLIDTSFSPLTGTA
jgi:hypothetical protein